MAEMFDMLQGTCMRISHGRDAGSRNRAGCTPWETREFMNESRLCGASKCFGSLRLKSVGSREDCEL